MFDSLFCTERKPMRSAQLQLHCSKCQGETRAVLNGFSPKTYQNKRWWRVRKWACKSTSRRHKTTGSETNLEKKKILFVALSDCNREMLLSPLHRWCVSCLSTSSPPSPPLPSPPFPSSLCVCMTLSLSLPLSPFLSLILLYFSIHLHFSIKLVCCCCYWPGCHMQ